MSNKKIQNIFLATFFFGILLFLFLAKPTSVFAADECATPGQQGDYCVVEQCLNGNVCAAGHKYCVWNKDGNKWGGCSVDEGQNTCATQCSPWDPQTPIEQQEQQEQERQQEETRQQTTCDNNRKVGEKWGECKGCTEGEVTCNGGNNYTWMPIRSDSSSCGSKCVTAVTPSPAGTSFPLPFDAHVTPSPAGADKTKTEVMIPASSSTPTGSIIGPANGTAGQPLTFTATVKAGSGNLTESNIYVTMANKTLPAGCPADKIANTYWCNIAKIPFTGAVTSKTYTADWTPQQTGSHTVIVNAVSSSGQKCTGNTYNPASGWINCGPDSAVSVTISSTPVSSPVLSPVCKGDLNNDGKLDNTDLEFWYASMAKGSSSAHCSSSGGGKTDLSDFYNWWINK